MLEALINNLKWYAKLENASDFEGYDATLGEIAELHDSRCIELLLPFFDDQCRFPEMMFSIIHTIERFDDQTYVGELIKSLPNFIEQSPYWAKILHFRIINSAPCFEVYKYQLSKAPEDTKSSAKILFTDLQQKNANFSDQCEKVLVLL